MTKRSPLLYYENGYIVIFSFSPDSGHNIKRFFKMYHEIKKFTKKSDTYLSAEK